MTELAGDQWINTRPLGNPDPELLDQLDQEVSARWEPSARATHLKANEEHAARILELAHQVANQALNCPHVPPAKFDFEHRDNRNTLWIAGTNRDFDHVSNKNFTKRLAVLTQHIRNAEIQHYAEIARPAQTEEQRQNNIFPDPCVIHPAKLAFKAAKLVGDTSVNQRLKLALGSPDVPWANRQETRMRIADPLPQTIRDALVGCQLAQIIQIPQVLSERETLAWGKLIITKAEQSRKGGSSNAATWLTLSPASPLPVEPEPSDELPELKVRWRRMASILHPF